MNTLHVLKIMIISMGIIPALQHAAPDDSICGLYRPSTDNHERCESILGEQAQRLSVIAQRYLRFVHDVGSASSVALNDPRVEALFAENLTKIDNRIVLFENSRASLLPQMRGFKKDPEVHEAAWSVDIDNALIIPSVETNFVVVHFEWKHIHVGRATTVALLQCNANGQIERIIDVWAPVPNG